MNYYDFCLTWCWEFDADFVGMLESECRSREMSVLQVTSANLNQVQTALAANELSFGVYLDRTEHEKAYEPVFNWARENARYTLNPKEVADWAEDKATMHLELVSAGLTTPFTILLPPYAEQPFLSVFDLSPLGTEFVIKPSFGGGGQGVVIDATSFDQVLTKRADFPQLKYLLQKVITPLKMEHREAWFRVIFCDHKVYPCWWDRKTHIYEIVTTEDESRFGLTNLRDVTIQIASICKLGFFSTEIAFSTDEQWVVIDYVNDQIDMRLQSHAVDGVPDILVTGVCENLADWIKCELEV